MVRQPAVRISLKAPPIVMAGVRFDNASMEEAIALIEQMIAQRKPHHVVTPNSDFLRQALIDVEFRRILFDAHLSLCDGMPLVQASRMLGNGLQERVAGSDLVPALVRVAAKRNYRIYFLGGSTEAALQAVSNLKAQFPRLNVVGFHSPPFQSLLEMDHGEITKRIRAARPDLLFVSLGTPKGEKWIAMHYRSLGVPVSINVGATIDFLAGRVPRAPRWMQRTGIEWIYRLWREPSRLFVRYASDFFLVGWALSRQWFWLNSRGRPHQTMWQVPVDQESEWLQLRLPARMDKEFVITNHGIWEQVLSDTRSCTLYLRDVTVLDSTGVALLMRLHKELSGQGRSLIAAAPSQVVLKALRIMQLEEFFDIALDPASAQELAGKKGSQVILESSEPSTKTVVSWFGEITAENIERIWAMSRYYFDIRQEKEWLVDLSQVRFMDSSGASLVVRLRRHAREKGALLQFVAARSSILNVLRLANVEIQVTRTRA